MRACLVIAVVGTIVAAQSRALASAPGNEDQAEKIASLIHQLGDDAFSSREAASAELVAIGEPALSLLRQAAESNQDLEIRWRADHITEAVLARNLPVGSWSVEFANGVTEACRIANDGEVVVDEPQRTSRGTAVVQGDSAVMRFDDDRTERWTRQGTRVLVEHWFPSSEFPTATPVLGIARRTP